MSEKRRLLASPRPARFLAIFAGFLLLAFGVLLTPPVQALDVKFSQALVWLSHGLVVACGGHATREAAILRSASGFGVEMRDGCNAVNVTILLWAAILAFPASAKSKAWGLLAGTVIVQALNIIRFISLYYVGQYNMAWFDFAHAYLWESLLVLDTMVIFWLWVKRART